MVNAEEIVERTFYICLLQTALKKGLTLNPEDYLPLSQENEKRFQADKDAMPKFIPIFGIGNNQVKGAKTCPRITIELQGFYNGDIGVNKYIIGDKLEGGNYQASEFPYETKDITLDIHLVSNTQADMRLLHSIMYEALPSRGYVRPYYNNLEEWEDGRVAPTGNLLSKWVITMTTQMRVMVYLKKYISILVRMVYYLRSLLKKANLYQFKTSQY